MLNYFLHTIRQLRLQETVTLYEVWSPQQSCNDTEVVRFLEQCYQSESVNYPYDPPGFEAEAALWGARTMYSASQFLLNRTVSGEDLATHLPDFAARPTPARILSADLTLRFLPDVMHELAVIDPGDPLTGLLEKLLTRWHYSGIRAGLAPDTLDFSVILADRCLHQLYLDRVITCKKHTLATHPALRAGIRHSLGDYATRLWSGLPLST